MTDTLHDHPRAGRRTATRSRPVDGDDGAGRTSDLTRHPTRDHLEDGPDALHGSTTRTERRRSRRVTLGAVAALVGVVAVLAAAAPTPEPTETVEAGRGPLVGDGGRGSVAPVSTVLRRSPVTAVTDTHHLVWGGEDGSGEIDRADGFTVELASGAVETIPNAPTTRLSETDGAWTGTELVGVSSGACASCSTPVPSAAAWDPERGWRRIAAPPARLGEGTVGAVWTGRDVVVVSRSGAAAAYDPATGRWDDLPSVPIAAGDSEARANEAGTTGTTSATGSMGAIETASLVWTGSDVVVWAGTAHAGPLPSSAGDSLADRGWALAEGGGTWRVLPDLPPGARTQLGSMVWTGTELVVWGAATGGSGTEAVGVGARLRPGSTTWTPLPASPQPAGRGFEGTAGSQSLAVDAVTGAVVLVPLDLSSGAGSRDLVSYDPRRDRWTSTDVALGGYAPTIAVTGGTVLVPHPGTPVAARLP